MMSWKAVVLSACSALLIQAFDEMTAFAGTYFWSTEVENTITTGDVSIAISEYELDETGMEIPYQDRKPVLPGQAVSKIVRIANEADDAWIRARVQYWSEDGIDDLDDNLLGEMGVDWKKIGEYYYLTRPAVSGEVVELFREIRIPAEWDEGVSNQSFQVDVTAQAVQTANLHPDFSQEAPWFGIPVEACEHSVHDQKLTSGDCSFSIVFENGTEGFVKSSEDFFEDFASMMPGDTVTGELEFGSRIGRTLDVSFRTETADGQLEDTKKLLEELQLTIAGRDQILYEGALHGETLTQGIELVSGLKKGENQIITFSLFMPETLNNSSALQQASVRWIFTTGYRTSSGSGGSGGSSDESTSRSEAVQVISQLLKKPIQQVQHAASEVAEYLGSLPVTGDSGNEVLVIVMIVSGTLAFLLSRKEDEDE